jgi:DNA-binding transcriptional LysR family regulator
MSDFLQAIDRAFLARAACEGIRIRFDEGFAETASSMSVSEVRTREVPCRTTDSGVQIVAVRQGLGMTTLPCFVGNADSLLVRMPGTDLRMHGTLWLLRRKRVKKSNPPQKCRTDFHALQVGLGPVGN